MAENVKKSKGPGFVKRIGRFFKDLKGETKKVVWPSKKQVINNTLIVLAAMLIVGVFVWGLDAILGFVFQTLLRNA